MTIPLNFVLGGAPKCGTTSLAAALDAHSSIEITNPKETFHFSPEITARNFPTISDSDYYSTHFRTQKPIRGDGSIWSMYSPSFVERLNKLNPQAKIILLLRSPEKFVSSLYHYNFDKGYDNAISMTEALDLESERSNGNFIPTNCPSVKYLMYKKLANFRAWTESIRSQVGRQRLCVLDLDAQTNAELLLKTFAFLNVPPEEIAMGRLNPGSYDTSLFNRALVSRISGGMRSLRRRGIRIPHTGLVNKFRKIRSDQLSHSKQNEISALRHILKEEIRDYNDLIKGIGEAP